MAAVHNVTYKYPVDEELFASWTERSAYILGFIVADGYIGGQGINRTLEIGSCDYDIIQKIRGIIGELPIQEDPPGKYRKKTYYRIRTGNIRFVQPLIDRGVCLDNKSKNQPSLDIPPEFFWHFARGFTDGDGCISASKTHRVQVQWGCSSLEFIDWFRRSINKQVGRNPQLVAQKGVEGHWKLGYSTKTARKILELLYTDATIYMSRKHQRAVELLGYDPITTRQITLADWARSQQISWKRARKMFQLGTLPVRSERLPTGMIVTYA